MLSMSTEETSSSSSGLGGGRSSSKAFKGDEEDDGANDDEEFTVGGEVDEGLVIQPRWPTRVFAAQCLRKIIEGSFTFWQMKMYPLMFQLHENQLFKS
jgi:hypothetical protein